MREKARIIIDPGHGGADPGAVYHALAEKDLALAIAQQAFLACQGLGLAPRLTRTGDETLGLAERAEAARAFKAELFLSLHLNAARDQAAGGMEVFVWEPSAASLALGQAVYSALRRDFPARPGRGVKPARFYVLLKTPCPAALVECEFLSNPRAAAWLARPETQAGLGRALARGAALFLSPSNPLEGEKQGDFHEPVEIQKTVDEPGDRRPGGGQPGPGAEPARGIRAGRGRHRR